MQMDGPVTTKLPEQQAAEYADSHLRQQQPFPDSQAKVQQAWYNITPAKDTCNVDETQPLALLQPCFSYKQ